MLHCPDFNVTKTQIKMQFYKLLLGSKNTTRSVTRNNGCLSRKNSLWYYGWYETKSPWKL